MAAELLIVGYDHGMFRHLKEPISGTVQCKCEQGICETQIGSPDGKCDIFQTNSDKVGSLSQKLKVDRRYLLEWCHALKLAGFLTHQKNPKPRLRSQGVNEDYHDLFELTDDLKDIILEFQPMLRKIFIIS